MPTQHLKVKQQSKVSKPDMKAKKESKPDMKAKKELMSDMKAKKELMSDMKAKKELMKHRQRAMVNKKPKSKMREEKSLAYITGYVAGTYLVYEYDLFDSSDVDDLNETDRNDFNTGKSDGESDVQVGEYLYDLESILLFDTTLTSDRSATLAYILGYVLGHGPTGEVFVYYEYVDLFSFEKLPSESIKGIDAGFTDSDSNKKYTLKDVVEFDIGGDGGGGDGLWSSLLEMLKDDILFQIVLVLIVILIILRLYILFM